MEHNYCMQCLTDLKQASSQGFIHDFRLLQDGSIQVPSTQNVYDLNDITVTVKCCLCCTISRYLITIHGGLKGIAVEFWETWSDKQND